MEFIDETLNKAKEAFDVAKKKTTEVYNIGKQKYDIANMENKLSKSYKELGMAAYNVLKEYDNMPDDIKTRFADIEAQIKEINQAKAEVVKMQNKRMCPACGNAVSADSTFCNYCGEKLEYSE